MVQHSKINPQKLRRVIEQNFDIVKERSNNEEVVIICPEASCSDKTGNRSINLLKCVTNCWKCSTANGHIVPFLRRHDIELDSDDLEEVIDPSVLDTFDESLSGAPKLELVIVELPEGFVSLATEPDSIYAKLIGQMAQRKNLYFDDFVEAGVGFTRVGEWEPYAIFPVYELGKLVYFQGRTYATRFEGGSTKRFPSKHVMQYGAGNWLYGYDAAIKRTTTTLIVVESILNVLSLRWELKCQGITGVEPVAVFKHKISKVQLTKLLVSPASEICILYDGDATASAWEEAKNLSGNRIATVATMPVGIDANDNAKLAISQFKDRQRYSPANALLDSVGL